jgi:hypothetical protein
MIAIQLGCGGELDEPEGDAGEREAYGATGWPAPPPAALPAPTEVRRVGTLAELAAALQSVRDGGHIVLRSGNYGGLTITRDRPASAPVVIRAESPLEARITAPWRLRGDGYILSGLRWQGANNQVAISASHIRLTRCAVLRTDPGSDSAHGRRQAIAISTERGEAIREIVVDRSEIGFFRQDGITIAPDGEITNVTIARNYLHDQRKTAIHNQAGCAVYVGWENTHREKAIRAKVIENLFERIEGKSVIHVKSSQNLIAFNHLRGVSTLSNFGNRHGRDNDYVGNRIEVGHLSIDDYNGRVLGNLIVGAGDLRALAGNWSKGYSYDAFPDKPETGVSTHPAARGTILAGNQGPLVLGSAHESFVKAPSQPTPCRDLQVFDHRGPIVENVAHGVDWVASWLDRRGKPAPSTLKVPAPVRPLAPKDVGPAAP